MVKRHVALSTLLLLVALPASAGGRLLTFDPAGTTVRFTLGATMHTVHGSFKMARGSVRFDAIPGPVSGEIVVDATSGDTANEGRDKKMNEEVLASTAFREIVLVPSRIGGEAPACGRGKLTVEGRLRLLGVEHPVEIPVEVEVDGDDVHLTASFAVPFVAWGLRDPSVFLLRVEKVVTVEVEARGGLSAAPPAQAQSPLPEAGVAP